VKISTIRCLTNEAWDELLLFLCMASRAKKCFYESFSLLLLTLVITTRENWSRISLRIYAPGYTYNVMSFFKPFQKKWKRCQSMKGSLSYCLRDILKIIVFTFLLYSLSTCDDKFYSIKNCAIFHRNCKTHLADCD
jgi:hypothetical protein